MALNATLFPTSLYKAQKFYGVKKELFEKYVTCKKCAHVMATGERYNGILGKFHTNQ